MRDMNDEKDKFTPQEYLETLIGILDTPIGRRKSPSPVKECVNHLATALEQGWQLR